MDTYFNKPESQNKSQNSCFYLSSQHGIHIKHFNELPAIDQQKWLESQSHYQEPISIQGRENAVKRCTPTNNQKGSLNELERDPIPLQQQQTTDFLKKVCDPTYNSQTSTVSGVNGSPFQKNKKQKRKFIHYLHAYISPSFILTISTIYIGLLYNNDSCNVHNNFSIQRAAVCDQGSSHTQEFQDLSTPYDKWTNTTQKGIHNDKQGNAFKKLICAQTILLQL